MFCPKISAFFKTFQYFQKWTPSTSSNLHGIQFRILKRGIELLEVGGRLVYSTCSLNPVEDEAVVQRLILEAGKDSVEIVDASQLVPGLKYSAGLSKWTVGAKDGETFSKWEDVSEKFRSQIRPYMFPMEGIEGMNMSRCMRILPHHHDTGGFFVAVLVKKALCSWESAKNKGSEISNGTSESSNGANRNGKEPPKKKPRSHHQGFKEDPYIYFNDEEPLFKEIEEYYGLKVILSVIIICFYGILVIKMATFWSLSTNNYFKSRNFRFLIVRKKMTLSSVFHVRIFEQTCF